MNILMTRPLHQAQNLIHLIEKNNDHAVIFPTIAIEAVDASQTLKDLREFHLIIFVSANAVIHALPFIKKDDRQQLRIAAMGHGTKQALERANLTVDFLPEGRFNSENLLQHPALQAVSGQKILIISGENSRNLLANTLRARQAQVTEVAVYRRVLPKVSPEQKALLLQQWQHGGIDLIVCTSNEGLQNLFTLLGPSGHTLIQRTPIIGVSERLNPLAQSLGCLQPLIAENANDAAIVKILQKWKETTHDAI